MPWEEKVALTVLGVIVTAILLLIITACGEVRLDRGEVIGKHHEPEHTYISWVPIQTGQTCTTTSYSTTGSSTTCTPVYTNFPFIYTDDEDWVLTLQDGEKKGVAYVSEDVFNRLTVGDYYDREQSGGTSSDKDKRGSRL